MADYSAVLAPPTGLTVTRLAGVPGLGADVLVDGSGHFTVSSQRAVRMLVGQGWTVVSVTPASVGGNQGW
jgi:hypothetical protein